jgi:cobalt-zinc-cadmium efflux system outer membrane protein
LLTVFRKGENVSFTSKSAALAILAWAWSGRAAEPLRLPDLIAEALGGNPEVRAAQKNYEAARQRPSRESSLPDPTLSLGYASNGGPLPGQQLGSNPTSNIGFMVSQQIPYPGKRKLRGDIAAKDAEAEFWQYQSIELNVRSRLIQAFHRLHHTYAALEILAHGKEVLTEMLRVSESAVHSRQDSAAGHLQSADPAFDDGDPHHSDAAGPDGDGGGNQQSAEPQTGQSSGRTCHRRAGASADDAR